MVKGKIFDERGEQLKMKKSFAVEKRLEPFYTGGAVVLSPDQAFLFCLCENQVKVVDLATGQAVNTFGNEEDAAITICVSDEILFTAHRASHLVKQWNWRTPAGEEAHVRSFKAHPVPVTSLAMDPSNSLVATGATDGGVRVWDIEGNFCTHQFKGSRGVVGLLKFHPTALHLFSSADDLLLKQWDLESGNLVRDYKGHVSAVTSLVFLDDNTCVSAGRDKVNTISLRIE